MSPKVKTTASNTTYTSVSQMTKPRQNTAKRPQTTLQMLMVTQGSGGPSVGTGFVSASQDRVTVKTNIMPWDTLYQKVLTAAAGKDGPDIVAMSATRLPQYVSEGLFQSVDDFYAAFPRDAAQSSEPTVIARWHQSRWHFITCVPRFLYAQMHTDRHNCLWICTGNELICFTPDGGQKLVYPLREPILADGLAEQ